MTTQTDLMDKKSEAAKSDVIVDYLFVKNEVIRLHLNPQDIEEGDLISRLGRFNCFVKTKLPISRIDLDEFSLSENLIAEYIQTFQETGSYPPVVYDGVNESMIDGLHRANAIHRCGLTEIDAYMGVHEHLDHNWVPQDDDGEADDEDENDDIENNDIENNEIAPVQIRKLSI